MSQIAFLPSLHLAKDPDTPQLFQKREVQAALDLPKRAAPPWLSSAVRKAAKRRQVRLARRKPAGHQFER
jgi:hypothetical protein